MFEHPPEEIASCAAELMSLNEEYLRKLKDPEPVQRLLATMVLNRAVLDPLMAITQHLPTVMEECANVTMEKSLYLDSKEGSEELETAQAMAFLLRMLGQELEAMWRRLEDHCVIPLRAKAYLHACEVIRRAKGGEAG